MWYKAIISDEYQYFQVNSLEDREKLQALNTTTGTSFSLSLASKNRQKIGELSVIDDSSLIIFKSEVISVFKEIGEFIQLKGLDGYNLLVPDVIDALDVSNSEIDYFRGTQEIKRIRKYSFNNKVSNKKVFKLPIIASPVFFSSEVVEIYNNNGFHGIDFVEIK